MKTVILYLVIVLITGVYQNAIAASGKCTVVEVQGQRMIIDCEQRTKGFAEGSKIKIKTEKKKVVEGC